MYIKVLTWKVVRGREVYCAGMKIEVVAKVKRARARRRQRYVSVEEAWCSSGAKREMMILGVRRRGRAWSESQEAVERR